jgi:hypothetical protein
MFDQMLESFRKASESSLQAQQDFFKGWVQQLPSTPFTAGGAPGDWGDVHKRWQEAATEALNRHRSLLDASYKSSIELLEQSFRFSEVRNPEDYRRQLEEFWRKLTDTLKAQSETQYRELRNVTDRWIDKTQTARAPSPS